MSRKGIYFLISGFFVVLVALFVWLFLPGILADNVYPLEYRDLIKKYSLKYGINPNLIAATIWSESHFNKDAVSPAGAVGMMQLMPNTAGGIANQLGEADSFSYDKLFDAETNIRYGTWYLAHYVEKYQDVSLALVAYNGGFALADYYSQFRNDANLNAETSYYYKHVQDVKVVYDAMYGAWWEAPKKKEKPKPKLPPIVLLIKHWLNL